MKFTEEQLRRYSAPLSDTEEQKCKNVIAMVRDALKDVGFTDDNNVIKTMYEHTYAYSVKMRSLYDTHQIRLFLMGSYANNTNIRTQSDVDIAVVQEDLFITEYREGITDADYGFNTISKKFSFKNEVQKALENKFGSDIERKNKSIKIHGNNYRKDADSVPCQRFRDYRNDFIINKNNYVGGIVIYPDIGDKIINYPEQHIINGRQKNNDTNYYYKKMVRIIKNMRVLMEENNYTSALKISSFGLESLLWNIPNNVYKMYTIYRCAFGEIVKYIYSNTKYLQLYKEANGIKELCPTQTEVKDYGLFINELYNFYEYDI